MKTAVKRNHATRWARAALLPALVAVWAAGPLAAAQTCPPPFFCKSSARHVRAPFPSYDIQKKCNSEQDCINSEKQASNYLRTLWHEFSSRDLTQCEQIATKDGIGSYVLLKTCVYSANGNPDYFKQLAAQSTPQHGWWDAPHAPPYQPGWKHRGGDERLCGSDPGPTNARCSELGEGATDDDARRVPKNYQLPASTPPKPINLATFDPPMMHSKKYVYLGSNDIGRYYVGISSEHNFEYPRTIGFYVMLGTFDLNGQLTGISISEFFTVCPTSGSPTRVVNGSSGSYNIYGELIGIDSNSMATDADEIDTQDMVTYGGAVGIGGETLVRGTVLTQAAQTGCSISMARRISDGASN